jgi:hypothetical protein
MEKMKPLSDAAKLKKARASIVKLWTYCDLLFGSDGDAEYRTQLWRDAREEFRSAVDAIDLG